MLFASADYLVFLLAVFFMYSLLRAGGRTGLVARLGILILLGDLVYLILCKSVGDLWDPLGALTFQLLLDEPPPLRAPADYAIGTAVFACGFALAYIRGTWLESELGQSWIAAIWAVLLTGLGIEVWTSFADGELEDLSSLFSEHGHLIFLFGYGIALGGAFGRDSRRLGQVVLFFIVSVIFYHAWASGMHGGYVYLVCLIVATIVLDYYLALLIQRSTVRWWRLFLLITSLVTNLGVLAMFKYIDFFIAEIHSIAGQFGYEVDLDYLGLILPAGISFHTFQSLSYTIDVYRGSVRATRSILHFATYVLFFPQLVAGPIVRAHEFLPQIEKLPPIVPDHAAEGLYRIIVGLFKKIALADVLAIMLADAVFEEPGRFSSVEVMLGVYAYAFQIYLDFSAYSDIAIGSAKLLGFTFPENFDTPYRSGNLQEFWRRWHITLSSWLRDYLYIPLGGSRGKPWRTYPNLMITMLLGGLWHGASWTFIIWGALHGGGLIFTRVFQRQNKRDPATAVRMLKVTVLMAGVGIGVHLQLGDWFVAVGDRHEFDPMWLHLGFGWAYLTPAWAAATAWLTAMPRPTVPASAFTGWHGPGIELRIAFLGATALVGICLWMGPEFSWLVVVAGWLVFACVGEIVRASPDPDAMRAHAVWLARHTAAALLTFHYVCVAWIFFRAVDFAHARDVLMQIGATSTDALNVNPTFLFVLVLAGVSHLIPRGTFRWLQHGFVALPPVARAAVMVGCAVLLSELSNPKVVPFIYFQF